MMRKTITVGFMVAFACLVLAQTGKTNLTGTWNKVSTKTASGEVVPGVTENMSILHNEPYIYFYYQVKDGMGERVLDLKGKTDGKPHEQKIDDRPATLIAHWEGPCDHRLGRNVRSRLVGILGAYFFTTSALEQYRRTRSARLS